MAERKKTRKSVREEEEGLELPGVLPIFPLPETVLLPGEVLPLHVFEPRYRELVRDALSGHRVFGVVAIRPGHEEEHPGRPPLAPVGCAGLIIRSVDLPDGRFFVWLLGLNPFASVEEVAALTPYRQVRISPAPAPPPPRPEEVEEAEGMRLDLLALLPSISGVEPERVSYLVQLLSGVDDDQFVAGVAQLLSVPPSRRQELLEAATSLQRLRLLTSDARLALRLGTSTPAPREYLN